MNIKSLSKKTSRTGLPLWLEISLIIALKIVSLFVLWKLFFSQPETKKMRLPTVKVEQHLLSTSAAASSSQSQIDHR